MTNLTNNELATLNYMADEAMGAIGADTLDAAREQYCAPCNHGELARATGLTIGQIRGVVTSLVKKDLVHVDDDNSDYEIWLTNDGFDAVEAAAETTEAQTGSNDMTIKVDKRFTDADVEEAVKLASPLERLQAYNNATGKDIKKFSSKAAGIKQTTKVLIAARDRQIETVTDEDVADNERSRKRAAGIAASWERPEVREKRRQRHGVEVDGVEYRSVRQAFVELELPLKEHIPFRMLLKEKGELENYGRTWKIIDRANTED